jgi:hypothetical protein
MTKVYCKDCEFYEDYISSHSAICKYPDNIRQEDHAQGVVEIFDRSPRNRNQNNDCNWFYTKVSFWKRAYCWIVRKDLYPQPIKVEPKQISQQEKDLILKFAGGDKSLKDKAIQIHRKYISILGVRGTIEMRYLAEIDNPCPDILLRDIYRKELLKEPYTNG